MTGPTERLRELSQRHALPDAALAQLSALIELVAEDDTAPTTIRDPAEAVDRHLADSLVALELAQVRSAARVADVGSGVGFPGLALAAALPASAVVLVEGAARNCRFLDRAVTAMGLENVRVVHARAEEWSDGTAANDLVTARALAALPVVLEYAAPLLAPGGALVAWKGRRDPAEETDAEAAARQLGLELVAVSAVKPFAAARHRHLYVYEKVAAMPDRFPRRAGIARKRPLSAGSGKIG